MDENSIIPQSDERRQYEEYSRLETLRSYLLTQRSPYQDTWEEIQHLLDPHMVIWSPATAGYPDFDDIKITSYPFQAFDDLTAGLCTGITPENSEWHVTDPEDEELMDDTDVVDWCHIVNQKFKFVFQNSNFYQEVPIFYRCGSKFLTAAMMVEEDFKNHCRFTVFPIGSFYCSNNGMGQVDTFIFETRLKVRQIVERFCEKNTDGTPNTENLGNTIKRAWEDPKQREIPFDMVWVVEPNLEYNEQKAKYHSKFKRYKATYYLRNSGDKRLIQERGFDEFPVFVFRWFRQPTDAYGVDGPGRKAIGDVKEIFKTNGMWNNACEKMIEPPMVAPPTTGQYPMGTTPGFLVTAPSASDAQTGIRPQYQIKPDLAAIKDKIMELKQRLDKTTYADIFRMIANETTQKTQPETATYWLQRIQENYNILAPVYGNFEHDWLKPMFSYIFGILWRQGEIPPPPQKLQGKNLKWNLVSRVAMALKLTETTPYEKGVAFIQSVVNVEQAAGATESVLDTIDRDEMLKRYFIASGVNTKVFKDPGKVKQERDQKAKQRAAAMQAQAMPQIGKGAKDMADAHATANEAQE